MGLRMGMGYGCMGWDMGAMGYGILPFPLVWVASIVRPVPKKTKKGMLVTFPETKFIEIEKTNLPKFIRLGSGCSFVLFLKKTGKGMLVTFPETKFIKKKKKMNLPKFVRLDSGRLALSVRPVPKKTGKGMLVTFPETKFIEIEKTNLPKFV
jgi:hypothetical protein